MNVALSTENQLPPVHNGGTQDVHINGLSNGHHSSATSKHKSSSKDKYRDKDKDHKSSNSSGHKSSSRDKEKHSHSSSSSKDKHRDKHRSDEKHGRSSSSHHHHHDRKKESNDKDKHQTSSSASHHHHHHKSSSKEKHHRHDKERTSSSSKDKSRHHKSHDKDYEKDHHRRHSSSSSSKHKHSSNQLPQESPSMDKTSQNENEFIKPEPVSQQVPDYSEQNGYNDGNIGFDIKQSQQQINCEVYNSYSNGYKEGYECKPNIKLEEQNYSITQANSYDRSYSEFKGNAIKSESGGVYNDYNTLKPEGEQYEEHQQQQDMEIPSVYTGSNSVSMEMNTTVASEQEDDDVDDDADDDDDDIPLSKRKLKVEDDDDDDEDIPLLARKKLKKESKEKKDKKKKRVKEEDGYSLEKPRKKLKKHETTTKNESETSPVKRGRKAKGEQEEEDVWRWWEEEKREDGVKWTTLEHKGPVFAPPYVRLPKNVRFFYDGKAMELSETTEEAASFYAKMLNHDYCTKSIFNENFFKDFRKVMNSKEREIIRDFRKCNFEEMNQYFLAESEKRKNATKEEKLAKKQENEALIKEYGVCIIDGHKEKIGNFRLEPPGLFRGRGEHPKMGMIKKRLQAEDISINCGKDSKIPEPPAGHRWREVIHNNTVTWLASWVENIQGQVKYIMLNPSSKLKGEKDHVKYETARRLDKCIESIRNTYRNEWKSKEMRVRQRAVALYFIDKLALRAGNEKDEDQADTVGCCSLRVEHVTLHKELHGKEHVVVFDFLGKDSIRYYNEVQVEKRVFKNLEIFMENKKTGDDLFDRLNTQVLNEHLKELMEGLTAKVFRTYNASITLQNQLDLLTKEDMTLPEKLLAYNRANRAVAILCNHQRSVPKSHEKSMETLKEKIRLKTQAIEECEAEYEDMRKAAKRGSVKEKLMADKKGKQLERLKEHLKKLELQETDRDENKTIALGTSKLNYLDPRISVAWCKKFDVPIEKIFNKTQRNKFMWAIHMADENYRF